MTAWIDGRAVERDAAVAAAAELLAGARSPLVAGLVAEAAAVQDAVEVTDLVTAGLAGVVDAASEFLAVQAEGGGALAGGGGQRGDQLVPVGGGGGRGGGHVRHHAHPAHEKQSYTDETHLFLSYQSNNQACGTAIFPEIDAMP